MNVMLYFLGIVFRGGFALLTEKPLKKPSEM
jgi:hypothetical protein